MTRTRLAALLSLVALSLPACATKAQTGAAIGAGAGALGGAIIGHNSGRHAGTGAVIGAGAGALGGYLIGNEMDKSDAEEREQQPKVYETAPGR
jgi:uncharacterized protein YcfJ